MSSENIIYNTSELASESYTFIGVEPSEKMLEIAKSRSQGISWLSGSAENIPAEANTFDGDYLFVSLENCDGQFKNTTL